MANPEGRPLLFKSVKELEAKIEEYFESCYKEVTVTTGKGINAKTETVKKRVTPFTVSGLAVYLECDRRTLLNYENNDEFFPTIKKAKQKIEADVEAGSLSGAYNPAASIFNLKNNFGWKDQKEVEMTGNVVFVTGEDELED